MHAITCFLFSVKLVHKIEKHNMSEVTKWLNSSWNWVMWTTLSLVYSASADWTKRESTHAIGVWNKTQQSSRGGEEHQVHFYWMTKQVSELTKNIFHHNRHTGSIDPSTIEPLQAFSWNCFPSRCSLTLLIHSILFPFLPSITYYLNRGNLKFRPRLRSFVIVHVDRI